MMTSTTHLPSFTSTFLTACELPSLTLDFCKFSKMEERERERERRRSVRLPESDRECRGRGPCKAWEKLQEGWLWSGVEIV